MRWIDKHSHDDERVCSDNHELVKRNKIEAFVSAGGAQTFGGVVLSVCVYALPAHVIVARFCGARPNVFDFIATLTKTFHVIGVQIVLNMCRKTMTKSIKFCVSIPDFYGFTVRIVPHGKDELFKAMAIQHVKDMLLEDIKRLGNHEWKQRLLADFHDTHTTFDIRNKTSRYILDHPDETFWIRSV